MKKTVNTSFVLPRIVYEAFKEYAEAEGKKPSHILQDWVSNAVGIPIKKETLRAKYEALLEMESIYFDTEGTYPSIATFYKAYRENRIQYREDGSVFLISHYKDSSYCFVPRTHKA